MQSCEKRNAGDFQQVAKSLLAETYHEISASGVSAPSDLLFWSIIDVDVDCQLGITFALHWFYWAEALIRLPIKHFIMTTNDCPPEMLHCKVTNKRESWGNLWPDFIWP